MPQDAPSPQAQLRAGRSGLLTSLIAAARAVEDANATPAMVAGALGGVVAAQTNYNNAVGRIPLTVMTEGQVLRDAGQAEPGPRQGAGIEPTADDNFAAPPIPPELIAAQANLAGTINARKWANTFLAVNKNQAIDREALVGWFANAIETGRGEILKRQNAAPSPPADADIYIGLAGELVRLGYLMASRRIEAAETMLAFAHNRAYAIG